MAGTTEAPIEYPSLEMPDNVTRKAVTIWSSGMALDADIYRPKNIRENDSVPAIVLTHGAGGDKSTCGRYAAKFASCGNIALCFTHASWGNSQGRLVPVGELPDRNVNNEITATVRMIRELLDPLEWVDSFRSALDYIEGEPNVDSNRIGAWGTSFGGGTAFYTTAIDKRIKALAIQVPAIFAAPDAMKALGKQRAIDIARGKIFPPIPQELDKELIPGLPGTPHFARMAQFDVAEKADHINVPTLIIDAECEEMYDITQSGGAAFYRLRERGIETNHEVIPGIDHYGIYFQGFELGCHLANQWFEKYL